MTKVLIFDDVGAQQCSFEQHFLERTACRNVPKILSSIWKYKNSLEHNLYSPRPVSGAKHAQDISKKPPYEVSREHKKTRIANNNAQVEFLCRMMIKSNFFYVSATAA